MTKTQTPTSKNLGQTVDLHFHWELRDCYGDSALGVIGEVYKVDADGLVWIDQCRDGSLMAVPADAISDWKEILSHG